MSAIQKINILNKKKWQFWIDRGGTFTDVVARSPRGDIQTLKLLSDNNLQYEDAAIEAIRRILGTKNEIIDNSKIEFVKMGTTVATNALLERNGERTLLVTTKGFKDALKIGYQARPRLFDLEVILPEQLYEKVIEIEERISPRGEILTPLDISSSYKEMIRAYQDGITTIAIVTMHGYRYPIHEKKIATLAENIGFKQISTSHQTTPLMKFVSRGDTTVVDAYLSPILRRYITKIENELEGVPIYFMQSNGGLTNATHFKGKDAILSGPAGGIVGAVKTATLSGYDKLICFDMGGTSTDVALIQNSRARVRRETIVADVRVRAPSVDVRTVGAGGGSIAFVPELTRALRVGPESAGAVPGPACYMKGGVQPTVCDANVVLGYLPSDVQLGGKMEINREASVAAVQSVADAMGIDLMAAAEGIIKIANESMFGALRLVSVEQGYDPRDFALVGFGGAGPLHANALGVLTDAWPVIIPPGPGVLCAYGDATTQVQDEAARTYLTMAGDLSDAQLTADLMELQVRAGDALLKDSIPASEHEISYQADLRYAGQAFQITIDFTEAELKEKGVALLTGQFDAEHEQLFTFKLDDGHEILMIRALAKAKAKAIAERQIGETGMRLEECKIASSRFYYEGNWYDSTIYDRNKLSTGLEVVGPAIVGEMDSTTIVLPGYVAMVDKVGNLLINPGALATQSSSQQGGK